VAPVRQDRSEMTLGDFLTETYEPWMRATYKGRARQVDRVRAAFADLLGAPLASITTAKVDRWRAERRNRRGTQQGRLAAPRVWLDHKPRPFSVS
jgi:hypothetical protein